MRKEPCRAEAVPPGTFDSFESSDALLPDDFPVRLLPYTINADNNDSASESPDSSSSASEHESLLSSISDVEIQPCMQDRPGVQKELYSPTSPAHFPELVEMPSGSTAFPGATLALPGTKMPIKKTHAERESASFLARL